MKLGVEPEEVAVAELLAATGGYYDSLSGMGGS